jgi:hypothetical protein
VQQVGLLVLLVLALLAVWVEQGLRGHYNLKVVVEVEPLGLEVQVVHQF